MANFLFTVWPFRGHYFPMVAIAHALRERGHAVAFYTGRGAQETIEREGFRCFTFSAVDEQRVDELMFSRPDYASWKLPFKFRSLLREWLLGTVPAQVRDLRAILRSWRPDAIVSETSMWAPPLVLHESERIPVAVFSTVVACLLPGPEAPLVGLGLPRPRSWNARALAGMARSTVQLLGREMRRAVDEVRRAHGLGALDTSVTEFTGRMPLYLVPSTREFDFNRGDLPPSVHYVGPCLWNGSDDDPAPGWLDELGHDRPWVHVTEGTMHSQQPLLLRAAARGLGGLRAQVILTTGGRRDTESLHLGALAPNTRLESWVAHDRLLPHLDLLVTTGGAGTVMSALGAGVPLIVVPTEWDKPENAQRVVESGAGLRLSPRRCTAAGLRDAVERVLGDPSFRRNAQRLAADFARHDGPGRAAELLEGLALQDSPLLERRQA